MNEKMIHVYIKTKVKHTENKYWRLHDSKRCSVTESNVSNI